MKDKTDEQLARLHRGGHDPAKIYNAYKRALEHKGGPTVILAKTVKGYGLGSAQARNATHSEKKLTDDGAGGVCEAVRYSDAGGGGEGWDVLPAGRRMRRRSQYMQAAARGAGRVSADARGCRSANFKAPELEFFKRVDWRARRAARSRRRWAL